MRYAIIIEKAENNYSAYVPDLPGCVTTGKTLEEIAENMKEAIQFHLDGLQPTFRTLNCHRSKKPLK
ncbi:type II toxin-antitoxin system HicB family antitoxin [Microcystis aeruginosa CS-555/01A07]|uniref:type II toxin-antitoxin system HicB family antitoxin n=1 Tax=Microcystis aeruginosa TaxID=1126 RepID=UPI00232C0FE3|nr:type II toxin-antitoxin system HicB family antitoxin [Microcystis aeruginosa]MDB9428462.1 type II toxin-antitoxin system HicB family antitoxin [Microcystis aeruginosa CS-555/01A07]